MIPLLPDPVLQSWVAMAAAVPLALAARQDLREMLISDRIHVALLAIFAVWAPMFLSPEEIGWRLVAAVAVLAFCLIAALVGGMGGGDMKLAAALTPFVDHDSAQIMMGALVVALLLLVIVLKGIRARWARRDDPPEWKSLRPDIQKLPMGVAIAGAGILYRVLLIQF